MFKPFSIAFFILAFVWFGSILITTDPQARMDRGCLPVTILDKVGSAGMQVLNDPWGESTHKFFEKTHYACRYIVWKTFYEEDWNKAQSQDGQQQSNSGNSGDEEAASEPRTRAKKPQGRHLKTTEVQ